MADQLKVYHVDETTLFAARSAEHAAELFAEWTGDDVDVASVEEASNEFLDKPIPEFDENEMPTGRTTTVRSWLKDAEPGFLAASDI